MAIPYKSIDQEFRKIIKILNEKNYQTVGCCQGHTFKTPKTARVDCYVAFKHKYNFPIPPEGNYKTEQENPANLECFFKTYNDGTFLQWHTAKSTRLDLKEEQRQEIMAHILAWAEALPPLQGHNHYSYEAIGTGKRNGQTVLSVKKDYLQEIRQQSAKKEYKEIQITRYKKGWW